MRVFIVHAHPEWKSFNGAMTREAVRALTGAGHDVTVSDLYGMAFNPVSDRNNFVTVKDAEYYRQQNEEAHAAARDGFAQDIQREMDKLFWCDALILQFPLWWFGLPAILKGWIDRVFASGGRIYGGGKWYDHGFCWKTGNVLGHHRWPGVYVFRARSERTDFNDSFSYQPRHALFHRLHRNRAVPSACTSADQ